MTQTTNTNVFTNVEYRNNSTKIFAGFYESYLFNSDTLYNIESNDRAEGCLSEGEEYDIDFDQFQSDISKKAVEVLEEIATEHLNEDDLILKGFELHHVNSPTYYNYNTDELVVNMEVNIPKLEQYCFHDNMNDFDQYLKDNFTSYDGFMSFIDNNINDFILEYRKASEPQNTKEIDVMIEYYLLKRMPNYTFDYVQVMAEYANECIYEYIKKVPRT